jgi:hypothetical protein
VNDLKRALAKIKWWYFPAYAIIAHTILVFALALLIRSARDPEAGIAWLAFETIDWPMSYFFHNHIGPGLINQIILLGALQWAVIFTMCGCVAKRVFRLQR